MILIDALDKFAYLIIFLVFLAVFTRRFTTKKGTAMFLKNIDQRFFLFKMQFSKRNVLCFSLILCLSLVFVGIINVVKPSTDEVCKKNMSKQFEVASEVKELANEIKETIVFSSLQQKQKLQVERILCVNWCLFILQRILILGQVLKENSSEALKAANELTKEILKTPPSGDVNDKNTMLHILNSMFDGCVFYDSTKNISLLDSSSAINDIFAEKPLVLQLENLNGIADNSEKTKEDKQKDVEQISEIKAAIQLKKAHPVLTALQVHNVPKERINIIDTFLGSYCFKYTVIDLEPGAIDKYINDRTEQKLAAEFPMFKDLKVHPLFLRASFDISMFDNKGNKDFSKENSVFEVGPHGLKRKYQQPTGWTRYGLKVLGKYGDDTWLDPFNKNQTNKKKDPGNWWRAYHGTGNAKCENFTPIDAMSSIYKTKFRLAKVHALGPGVYCSPDPNFYCRGSSYIGQTEINLTNGKKKFDFIFQVAVKPGVNTLTPASNDQIWSVQNPDDIRVYGILVREV
ncbi:hypothetical protein RFI_10494 [Reticulomyxa filosa]|uniref:Uncharacterized protein n=1 Tax=Reticulomyxa filosa TaxID=46433 RepID=X6NK03_RETFI|nr:hypothetical protein RFI_10494 [Reticulomyxa filosa]|eukprot:ETO26640.1 hypothetical protein RFI_10494 [Reticulomyxa filosa]